jgi:uncharacterized protein YjiS (DUF1127 family)
MREWTLTQAIAIETFPPRPFFSRLWRNWQARRALRRMLDLDDRMLADLGVTPADIRWAAGLPLNRNGMVELEERARARSRRQSVAI